MDRAGRLPAARALPHRLLLPWLAVLWLLWAAPAVLAQVPAARESAVKAAFLYKFPAFVEWPAGTFRRADEPLTIAVVGNEPVAADLEQLATGRAPEGRPVAVRRLREGEVAGGAHVLFVGATSLGRLREITAGATGAVLVVSEQEGGLRGGSIVNFMPDQGRIRFSASIPAAEARGLRLSARLLAVAMAVEGR